MIWPIVLAFVSVTSALASGGWLDVPFVQQEKDGCGSASVWMIMEYWRHPHTPAVEDIHRTLYSKEAKGIYARDMERFLHDNRFRTFAFKATWDDLAEHTSNGRPLIVCLERNGRGIPLHYVVVAGIDRDQDIVWINDPAQRKLLPVRRDEFEAAWSGTDNWTLLALPEQNWAVSSLPTSSEATIDPSDLQMASDAFRAKDLAQAERHLHSALRADPGNSFTNDFLGTTYFLDGNFQAALKYWNRAAKPKVRDVHIEPPLRTDPVLLDRLFAFSRASVLDWRDFRKTLQMLDGTGIFPRYEFDLTPTGAEGDFDLTLRANERNGPRFLSWLGGVPFQTIYPQWWNARGQAVNIQSIVRWHPDMRRAFVSIVGPFPGKPTAGYRFQIDVRDENWQRGEDAFNLRRGEIEAEVRTILNDRWTWSNGLVATRRTFTNSLAGGTSFGYKTSVQRVVLNLPEKRFSVDSSMNIHLGRMTGQPADRFLKLEGELAARGFLARVRDDYESSLRIRSGHGFGRLPFDDLFILGLDRDGDRRLRAHPSTQSGRKGTGPMGSSYALLNYDLHKNLYDHAFIGIKGGPFLDAARISSDKRWLVDAGVQLRLSLLNAFTVSVSVGRDLRNGHTATFVESTN